MFDNYIFHPSSLGLIMTESRTKDPFGETCKSHLMECYVSQKYGRYKDITNKYIEKGIVAEEDSIDLYSVVKNKLFIKNTEVMRNDFFVGTPDLIDGKIVIDLKTSWDIFTFFGVMAKALDKRYYWQLQAYMDLTGCEEARLVYCLVNTPFKLIEDAKKKLMWTMAVIDPDTDEAYQKACEQVEKNSIYDDIPMEDRYIDFVIPRNQDDIDKSHKRVKECREFLNALTK
jgi:hypothetical protein